MNTVLENLQSLKPLIGNTPLRKLNLEGIDLFVKLERLNMTESIKDRCAHAVLVDALKTGKIKEGSLVVESSSGNFAIAAATLCNFIGMKFIAIIDDNANDVCKKLIEKLSHDVIVAKKRDASGGFIESRLENVRLLCEKYNAFWTNQYSNPANFQAHYHETGVEICDSFNRLDYVFIGMGTCGTISGVSNRVKEKFPNCKVIAVDAEGSLILQDQPNFKHVAKPRHIAGLGLNFPSSLFQKAQFDDFVVVSERDAVLACHDLLENHSEFAGGSSGTVFHAIKTYFRDKVFDTPPTVLFISSDGGGRYINSIYNPDWVKSTYDLNLAASSQFC